MITMNRHDDLLLNNDFMLSTSEKKMWEKKLLIKLLYFVGKN